MDSCRSAQSKDQSPPGYRNLASHLASNPILRISTSWQVASKLHDSRKEDTVPVDLENVSQMELGFPPWNISNHAREMMDHAHSLPDL